MRRWALDYAAWRITEYVLESQRRGIRRVGRVRLNERTALAAGNRGGRVGRRGRSRVDDARIACDEMDKAGHERVMDTVSHRAIGGPTCGRRP